MISQRFYYIEDISTILGKSIGAIYAHLGRRQYDAVPPPMKLGRRLAWLVDEVDEWVNAKVQRAKEQAQAYDEYCKAPARCRKGRPTKAEMVKARGKLLLP
jgi:predicted DNA-binding transcriptional regulator AlpA